MIIKGKTILVTGGAGFIGSHTVNELIARGGKVVVLDNLSTGNINNVNQSAIFHKVDVANPKINVFFKKYKPSIVYHFAFNTSVPKSVQNPEIEIKSIKGSVNVLQNSRVYNVDRFIFASSGFIYGNCNKIPTTEEGIFDPLTPYAIAKKTVEDFTLFYNKTHNLNCIILRYGTVYGPSQNGGAMTDYIKRISSGDRAEIWGDGLKTRDYIFIKDVVEANLFTLDIPTNYKYPIFNIGTKKQTSLIKLYKMIATKLDRPSQPKMLPDRPGELFRNCLDYSKFSHATNWKPKISLDLGLDIKIENFLKNKT